MALYARAAAEGADGLEWAIALQYRGLLHAELTRLPQAARHFRDALTVLAGAAPTPECRVLVVRVLTQLGHVLRLDAQYPDAVAVLADAQRQADALSDPVLRAEVANALGVLARDTAQFHGATACYAAAGGLLDHAQGDTRALRATLEHNLAGLAYAQGRYVEAEPHARRALALRLDLDDVVAANPAVDLAELGAILAAQGRHDEAEPLLHDALRRWQGRYGANHYEVAVVLRCLAQVAAARGDDDEARTHDSQASAVKAAVLRTGHPETLKWGTM